MICTQIFEAVEKFMNSNPKSYFSYSIKGYYHKIILTIHWGDGDKKYEFNHNGFIVEMKEI